MATEEETVKFWRIYSQIENTIKEFPELGKITLPRIVVVGSQVGINSAFELHTCRYFIYT